MPLLGTFGSNSVKGVTALPGGGALYPFTSHIFTTAGLSGSTGPTLSQLRSAYSSASWAQNSAFLNVTTQGIQNWTVPQTGDYRFDVVGASGASNQTSGGNGGRMQGTISLTAGEILYIVVGQTSNNSSGAWGGGGNGGMGGGGASDVRRNGTSLNDRIIVAGGGGGGSTYNSNDRGTGGAGGYTSGTGGFSITTPSGYGIRTGYGGSQSSGGSGGDSSGGSGSFGQGGSGASGVGGGGGGGYYGGGGGGYWTPGANSANPGGGGSSYYNTSLFSSISHTTGFRSGNGYITITLL